MTTDFTGKTALITGAGRGIGRAVALGLADAGAGLILLARSEDQLAETRAMVLVRGVAADRVRVIPFAQGALLTPGQSAAALIAHLSGDDTGAIWDVSTAPAAS